MKIPDNRGKRTVRAFVITISRRSQGTVDCNAKVFGGIRDVSHSAND